MSGLRTSFSAPATLDRGKRLNWVSSAKEMFMRPWRLRSQRRARRARAKGQGRPLEGGPTSLTSFEGYPNNNPFQQGFPNFSNRLSPLGGIPLAQSSSKSGASDAEDENREAVLKILETTTSSRPPLSNIFPLTSNIPNVSRPKVSSILTTPPTSKVGPQQHRRHSTPTMPTAFQLPLQTTPLERRASSSSDTSADKPRKGRRERRASVTREIPLLPKRGDNPFQPLPIMTPPPISRSPYCEPDGPEIDHTIPNQITMNFGPLHRPPVAPGGDFSSYWPQPCQQLKELAEELEEDGEGDGEDEGVTIGELEEWEGLKAVESQHEEPRGRNKANKSALGKLLHLMSSSKSTPDGAKEPKEGEEEEDKDVKGFDGFFLY